ncbi:hypothetical protein CsatB_023615 [Cannabis sativa]
MGEIQYFQLKKQREEVHEYCVSDSDIAAAQRLVQLSDENSMIYNNTNCNVRETTTTVTTGIIDDDENEVDQVFSPHQQICMADSTGHNNRNIFDEKIISFSGDNTRILSRVVAKVHEEIFGKDDEDIIIDDDDQDVVIDEQLPLNKIIIKKKKRFRSLGSIYSETKAIDNSPKKKMKKILEAYHDKDER